jgi:hypothetical protein
MIAGFIAVRERPARANLSFSTFAVLLFGVGYAFWGLSRVSGVPDALVNPDDVTFIWQGLGLIILGIIMYFISFYLDIRRRCPVK